MMNQLTFLLFVSYASAGFLPRSDGMPYDTTEQPFTIGTETEGSPDMIDNKNTYNITDVYNITATNDYFSVGNVVYSSFGFLFAGTLMFVILFDPLRMPIVDFFDTAYGVGITKRQRRSTGMNGLVENIEKAFETFTKSIDRITDISESVKNL